jgi:hypothetical protein
MLPMCGTKYHPRSFFFSDFFIFLSVDEATDEWNDVSSQAKSALTKAKNKREKNRQKPL